MNRRRQIRYEGVEGNEKWCIMLAFAMLLLSGCGKQAESTEVITEESNTEEPEPATTEALETVVLKDAKIGDIVQMGTYEQDGDAETEDPICWDVLDKDGDAVLLISHDVIAYQRFSDSRKCVIWEDSEIRTWLNQEFYAEAFDETEQASIRETTLENPSTVGFAAHVDPSGDVQVRESRPDTKDKIFLLSWKEAEQYYGNRLTDASVLDEDHRGSFAEAESDIYRSYNRGASSDVSIFPASA